jgi:hypothetical protein
LIITVQTGRVLSVDLASPTNGIVFAAPANIQLIAGARKGGGSVADVQFFDGTNSLGVVSNGEPMFSPPWQWTPMAYRPSPSSKRGNNVIYQT